MYYKILSIFGVITLVSLSIFLMALTRNAVKNYNYIGVSEETRRTIFFGADGSAVGRPDIARLQLGHNTEQKTVQDAQKENTIKINAITDKLKNEFKIDEKDIKTGNYNIYPSYDWKDGQRALRGYEVNQNMDITIRDLNQVSKVIAVAGDIGLNNIGNLNFEIDKPDILYEKARSEAINKAKKKAEYLSEELDVKLGKIVSINESSNNNQPPLYTAKEVSSPGMGGGDIAPTIQSGSSEIKVNVSLEYEVL